MIFRNFCGFLGGTFYNLNGSTPFLGNSSAPLGYHGTQKSQKSDNPSLSLID